MLHATGVGINVTRYGLYIRQPSSGQTLIELPRSAAGTWTLQSAPGSPPLKSVAIAKQLPEPKIKARVGGHGVRRVLNYSLTPQPGLTVRFLEGVGRGASPIGEAHGARGQIRFSPSLGSGATRTIIAELIRNGRPAGSKVIARFAPGTIHPGRPSQIRVRHLHGSWRISFQPGANTTEQQLTIRFADGAQVLLVAPHGKRAVNVGAAIDRTRPIAIQIVGLRGATRGPAARLTARATRRHG